MIETSVDLKKMGLQLCTLFAISLMALLLFGCKEVKLDKVYYSCTGYYGCTNDSGWISTTDNEDFWCAHKTSTGITYSGPSCSCQCYEVSKLTGTPRDTVYPGPKPSNQRPSAPGIFTVNVSGQSVTFSWSPSRRDESASSSVLPDKYEIVWSSCPITLERFEDILATGIQGTNYVVLTPSNSSPETYAQNFSPGRYYVKIRARNTTGDQKSNPSGTESPFEVHSSAPVTFLPNPIPKMGVAKIKMTLGSQIDLGSSISVKVVGAAVDISQDPADPKTIYFMPPNPGTNTSLDVEILGLSSGNISLPGAITVNQADVVDASCQVLDGAMMEAEDVFNTALQKKNSGELSPSNAFYFLVEETYKSQKITASIWADLLAQLQNDDKKGTMIKGIFDQKAVEAGKAFDDYANRIGPVVVAVAKAAASQPAWGQASFFTDAKAFMEENNTDYFVGNANGLKFVALKDSYRLKVFDNTTPGRTITEATTSNPNARVLINGTQFESLRSIGLVINNYTLQPSSPPQGTHQFELAGKRWWFGEQRDGLYVHGGRLWLNPFRSGHPPLPGSSPLDTDLSAAIGGMYIYITDKHSRSGLTASHIVDSKEDGDLDVLYNFFRSKFFTTGYGGIAVDRDAHMIAVFAKPVGLALNAKDTQRDLFTMGSDFAVGVDGGSSIALAIQVGSVWTYPVRDYPGSRHVGTPSQDNTITTYFVFE